MLDAAHAVPSKAPFSADEPASESSSRFACLGTSGRPSSFAGVIAAQAPALPWSLDWQAPTSSRDWRVPRRVQTRREIPGTPGRVSLLALQRTLLFCGKDLRSVPAGRTDHQIPV